MITSPFKNQLSLFHYLQQSFRREQRGRWGTTAPQLKINLQKPQHINISPSEYQYVDSGVDEVWWLNSKSIFKSFQQFPLKDQYVDNGVDEVLQLLLSEIVFINKTKKLLQMPLSPGYQDVGRSCLSWIWSCVVLSFIGGYWEEV